MAQFRCPVEGFLSKHRAVFRLLFLVPIFLAVLSSEVETASASASRRFSRQDIQELTNRLFPSHARGGFATSDLWASLSQAERDAWTSVNRFVSQSSPYSDARQILFEREPIRVPVRVIIVSAESSLSSSQFSLSRVGDAMRAGFAENASDGSLSRNGLGVGGIQAKFTVDIASSDVQERLVVASKKGRSAMEEAMEHVLGELVHATNVLFVLDSAKFDRQTLGAGLESVNIGQRERISWVVRKATDNLLRVLNVAEEAARVFVPEPVNYPLPALRQFRIDVHPYTPKHQHRALWYSDFDWSGFEAEIRALAIPGQIVGFFSSETTEQCGKVCKKAFSNFEEVLRTRAVRAASTLNGYSNVSWAAEEADRVFGTDEQISDPEFNIYVVDTSRLSSSAILSKLEAMPPVAFPGIAILFTRSSKEGSSARLKAQLISAYVTGVSGVGDAQAFLSSPGSRILGDVIARNYVSSMLAAHARSMVDLLDDIKSSGIRPSQALGDKDYSGVVQRLNLLVAKQHKARQALFHDNDVGSAVYFASSALFDIRAIRRAFGLSDSGKPPTTAGFRDPTIRCHFSRIKIGALVAGELFHRHSSDWGGFVIKFGVFLFSLTLTRRALQHNSERESQLKRR